MTGIALCLAAEEIVTRLLLRRELRLAGLHRIELGSQSRHLRRSFIAGNGLRHVIERGPGTAAINLREMHRRRVARGWRARLITDLLDVSGPLNSEGLSAPDRFEQRAIWPL